jgi:hypothetical protein
MLTKSVIQIIGDSLKQFSAVKPLNNNQEIKKFLLFDIEKQ